MHIPLTKEDLLAISKLINDSNKNLEQKLEPITKRLDKIEEKSKQVAIRAAKQREADKKEIMAYTDKIVKSSVEKLQAKFN